MRWKPRLLKHISESALSILLSSIPAWIAIAIAVLWRSMPRQPLGWLQILEVGLLISLLILAILVLISQRQSFRERREQLSRERHEVEAERDRRDKRERALMQLLSQPDVHPDIGGRAYILLKVKPSKSDAVARAQSAMTSVQYAIGVWGQWDVIIRVETTSPSRLITFLTALQNDPDVERTETLVIRSDQDETKNNADGRWGVLLLRLAAAKTGEVLKKLKDVSDTPDGIRLPGTDEIITPRELKIQHAVGVLGQYDIALTIRYANDESLAKFVMRYVQDDLQAQTTTMPAIRRMAYKEGNLSD